MGTGSAITAITDDILILATVLLAATTSANAKDTSCNVGVGLNKKRNSCIIAIIS